MATYNGERFIYKQIHSILKQLNKDDEIIVSDDSSTDKTLEIILSFNDPRIKIFQDQKFRSPIFNFENALKYSKGNIIFLSDQDDIWADTKVKTTLQYLNNYDSVVSDCNIIDDNGLETHSSFYELNGSKSGLINNYIKNSYLGCCMAFKRSILDASLPFPKNIAMHDIWIGIISELLGNPIFIADKLISHRRHSLNFSPTSGTSSFSAFYKIKYRAQFAYYALIRYLKLKLQN
jgi:glycosyltransferase involved in cell wall biosynthesis